MARPQVPAPESRTAPSLAALITLYAALVPFFPVGTAIVFVMLTLLKGQAITPIPTNQETAIEGLGNTEALGDVLYSTYLFPFEVASLILLVAMIGAIVLAKKDIGGEAAPLP